MMKSHKVKPPDIKWTYIRQELAFKVQGSRFVFCHTNIATYHKLVLLRVAESHLEHLRRKPHRKTRFRIRKQEGS